MSWKRDLQLRDLEDDQSLELTCRLCGHTHYETPARLLRRADLRWGEPEGAWADDVKGGDVKYLWLDELEALLRCARPGCGGPVRLALVSREDTEGFSGGLA